MPLSITLLQMQRHHDLHQLTTNVQPPPYGAWLRARGSPWPNATHGAKKKNTRGLAFGKLKRCVKKSIYSTENWPGDGCFPTNGCLSRVQHPPTKIHGSSWSPHGHGLCRIFFGLGDNLEKTKIRFGQWMNWLVYSRLVAQQIIRNQRPPATRWPIHTSNNRSPFPNSIQFQEFTNCTWTRTGQQIWTCSQSYLCWKKT